MDKEVEMRVDGVIYGWRFLVRFCSFLATSQEADWPSKKLCITNSRQNETKENYTSWIQTHHSYWTYLSDPSTAVAVGRLHEVDVLQEVGHSDGRVQLSRLVRRLGSFAVVPRNVQQPAVLRSGGTVVLIFNERGRTDQLHGEFTKIRVAIISASSVLHCLVCKKI
ncbi:hypothetical protein EYF80_040637 [Liparis tanakae]|uniref:Uncharacterized protein n=1 Tax=Liparis tanakae TaxID=230148 RepID=A0A4Z2G8N4_9TELE|nr:hypothetical protein EYF80_040637 [Liparis tanakae]